jgi:endonuclease YncB( thermonuclease family)
MIPRQFQGNSRVDQPSYTARRDLLNLIVGGLIVGGGSARAFRPARAESIAGPAGLSAPEGAQVDAVIDGDTLQLADGAVLRLTGIEAPKRDLAPNDAGMAALADAAQNALQALIDTKPVALRLDAGKRDRYGRRLAQVFNSNGDWLQAALVLAGHARVRGDGRNRLGLATLLQLETSARANMQGLWRHPAFAVRRADDPKLARFAGSYQIIAGSVFGAAVMNGTGFINFSPDRATDLTLVLKKPALDLFARAMLDVGSLTGKTIRCRGWLDLYDGPRIEITHPEQIEVLAG